jgi:hypothetical protein
MDNEVKLKSFMISDKINNLGKADALIGIHIELVLQLGLPVSTLNTTMKNCEAIERNYVQC